MHDRRRVIRIQLLFLASLILTFTSHPLQMINGGTGPVLAFTEILYSMSVNMDVPFLTFNAWIGIWVCIFMVIAAFVNIAPSLRMRSFPF